ncbi:FAD-dependent oxidoreductase [Pseudomonas entomophila]|uniref:FAD-dependent oxidoreductase n=1 Tax=Pseudomonas entomophila TaxID=312306 RepID=UPI003EB9050F
MTLHAVTLLDTLSDPALTRVQVGDEECVLVRRGDAIKAFEANCPHAGAPLEEGALCEGVLVCPWHKAVFDLDSGALEQPPALRALKRYPVQVKDGMVWVDDRPVPASPLPARAKGRCFAVIGAGAAGAAAVATLRAEGFAGRLVWIDPEAAPAYDRTALSKFVIAGEMNPDEVPPLLERAFYREADVERVRGKVKAIDVKARQLLLAEGRTLDYDEALLVTGGVPVRPSLPGANLPGVLLLRSREDAERVLDQVEPGQPVVVIGDSFIGLEAASALRRYGAEVHVVTRHEVPLARQLGERLGRAVRALHVRHGTVFHGPTEPVRFEGGERLEAVVLADGTRLATSVALLGTGVAPASALLSALRDEHGCLPVDAGMRLADGLWAAGDLVSFPLNGERMHIEHWRVAQQHGVIAAANMLGQDRHYTEVPFFWTHQHDKTLEVLGHAQHWTHAEHLGDLEGLNAVVLLCVDERVEAVVACEHQRLMAALARRMLEPLSRVQAMAFVQAWEGNGSGSKG